MKKAMDSSTCWSSSIHIRRPPPPWRRCAAATTRTSTESRGLPAAGVHAARDFRFGHRIEPLAAVRERVIEPLFESSPITHHAGVRERLGFGEQLSKNYEMRR